MEADSPTFVLDGIVYRISPHIWRNYPVRIGQVTVERIRNTISQPDIQVSESRGVTLFWKWFPEIGSGNFLKVVVRAGVEIHVVITAHPDGSLRSQREGK